MKNFIKRLHDNVIGEIPYYRYCIEKFQKHGQPRRIPADISIEEFLENLNEEKCIYGKAFDIVSYPEYLCHSGVWIEFFIREVIIKEEEYCLWIRIPYTERNVSIVLNLIFEMYINKGKANV